MLRIFDRVLRVALAAIFILYAVAKFTGNQFSHIEVRTPASDVDSVTLVWFFFGFSKPYAMFIACGELTAAVAILFRKTFRIGLLAYFSIALNVAVLDWSFGIPPYATGLATGLALGSVYLIIRERAAYRRLFD